MTTWHYVLMYNEMRILPLMYNYWKTYADKVIVIDSNSNDGSLEYLKSIKDIEIEIRQYDSNNQLDDTNHQYIKNNIWKEARGKCDFVVVSDMDETLYSPNGIRNELAYMLENKQTIVHPKGYNLYTEDFPEYNNNALLHTYEKHVLYDGVWQNKDIIFNPNEIEEINFCAGGHTCQPTGNVKYFDKDSIIELHLHNLGICYKLEHFHKGRKRLSELNKKKQWGFQYFWEDEKIINEFKKEMENCVSIDDVIKEIKCK